MEAIALERPASSALEAGRVRDLALVRIVGAEHGISKADLLSWLAPLASDKRSSAELRPEEHIEVLAAEGLVEITPTHIIASHSGRARAAAFLGAKSKLPDRWDKLCEARLLALALGLKKVSASRLRLLTRAEGLRAAILERAYRLKLRGGPTPAQVRAALAVVALERAFGQQVKALGAKPLSAAAGRLLAAQLSRTPRNFGTDARLIAALAAEQVGAAKGDFETLRRAVLHRFIAREVERAIKGTRPPRLKPLPPPESVQRFVRPDLAGFCAEVRRLALASAQGWPGNRKAYISHVWRLVREKRPDWGLSELEFKSMLAEAHRAGHVLLSNADLKDAENLQDTRESTLSYQNAVFHVIRIDD
jgi:hypothetical protein